MKKIITALHVRKGQEKRVNVSLDGEFAFSLEAEVAVKEGLRVGQELSGTQIETLAKSDCLHRCLNAATRYLRYRPRSESELRARLCQRGFDNDIVEAVMAKLKEQGLVDDMAFAQFWLDSRELYNPRSRQLTGLELRRKGVASDIIDSVVDPICDEDSAYQAARNKARILSFSDYQSFYHRLGGYLRRRGFSYQVINNTIKQIWQERGGLL